MSNKGGLAGYAGQVKGKPKKLFPSMNDMLNVKKPSAHPMPKTKR